MNFLRRLLNRLRSRPEDDRLSSMSAMNETMCRCEDLVIDFCGSTQLSIEISEATFSIDPNPVLKHLQGGSYREIRNRFRVISNLDPVMNKKEETGLIRMSYSIDESDEKEMDVELRTIFPADNTRFQLRKVKITPSRKYPAS